MHAHGPRAFRGERPHGHAWAQIRATDAEVDDVSHGLTVAAPPLAVADAFGGVEKAGELCAHLELDGLTPRGIGQGAAAQCHVQGGAPFGGVDGLASPHRLDMCLYVTFLRQRQQRVPDGQCDGLAGGVQCQAGGVELQRGRAFGVGGCQQGTQVGPRLVGQGLQALPRAAPLGGDENRSV